jgi:hypothetical protein
MRALWGLYRTLHNLGDKIEPEYSELKQVNLLFIIEF